MSNKNYYAITLLRLGLAFVFLWFGFSQISNAAAWTRFVPEWAGAVMNPGTLVLLNGVLEIIGGALLAFGIASRYVGLILGIHLFVIAVSIGLTAVGVRDIGLSFATIALFLLPNDKVAMSYYFGDSAMQ